MPHDTTPANADCECDARQGDESYSPSSSQVSGGTPLYRQSNRPWQTGQLRRAVEQGNDRDQRTWARAGWSLESGVVALSIFSSEPSGQFCPEPVWLSEGTTIAEGPVTLILLMTITFYWQLGSYHVSTNASSAYGAPGFKN
jgi:hypothetical protein